MVEARLFGGEVSKTLSAGEKEPRLYDNSEGNPIQKNGKSFFLIYYTGVAILFV